MMLHRAAYIFVAALAAVAVLTLVLRFALSQVDDYGPEIAAQLSKVVGAEVRIGAVWVALRGFEPVVELSEVRVAPSERMDQGLQIRRMRVEFDLLTSLLRRQTAISDLHIFDTRFLVVTDAVGGSSISGFLPVNFLVRSAPSGSAVDFKLHLERANIRWRNERAGTDHEFKSVSAVFEAADERLRLAAKASLPSLLGRITHVAADLDGVGRADGRWGGRVYVRADGADLAQWVRLAGKAGAAEGTLSAELWSDWRDGRLRRLDGALTCGTCVVAAVGSDAVSLQTRLSWEMQKDGWRLGLLDFGWASPNLAVNHSDVAVTYRKDDSRLVLRTPTFDAGAFNAVAEGRFQDSGVEISAGHGTVALSAAVTHPDFKPPVFDQAPGAGDWRRLPEDGLRFVSGYAAEYVNHLLSSSVPQAAQVDVALKQFVAAAPAWSERTFNFDEVSASVRYADDAPAYAVYIDDLLARFGGAQVGGKVAWTGGEVLSVDAALAIENFPLASVMEWLPREELGPRLTAWLDKAFEAGVVESGRVELNGAPALFPFKDGGGRFHAEGQVVGATLNYRANRRPLRDLDARVVFDNQSLAVEASGLRYYDLFSPSARVIVRDVTQPLVEVDVTGGEGPFADIFSYLKDARLVNLDSVVIRSLEPGGGSRLDLMVKAPLSAVVEQPVTVEGTLSFDGASLRVVPLDIEFSDIAGVLNFDRDGGSARSLTASLNGVTVTGAAKPAQGATTLTLESDLVVSQLFDLLATPLHGLVQGSAPWRAELLIPNLRAGADDELKMTLASSLEGVTVALPAPFNKTASQRRDFSADIVLGGESEYALSYGGEIRAALIRDARVAAPSGYLHFGAAALPAVEYGRFKIGGEIKQAVEIDDWLALAGGDADWGRYLDHVALSFAELRKGGEVLGVASVAVKPGDGGRELQIDAPWAQGWVFMPAADDDVVFAKMEKLFLPKSSSTAATTVTDPATVPAFEMEVADFRRGDLNVSDLHLVTEPSDRGMRIGRLVFEVGEVLVKMSGRWQFNGQQHRSRFNLDVNGHDYGRMLRMLGVSNSLKGGRGSLTGRVAWDDRPAGFELSKLEGGVKVNLTDGVIEKADPSIGRLFGLFSVGHIVRRLSLDFRDVIEKGLAFDTFEGNLNFRDSVMRTKDFVITGPALAMAVSGDSLIAERRYDQQIDVVPNLSSGLPVVSALLAGPIAGAAVYLVDKLTNIGSRMDKVVTLRYHLHGSWDDPQVDFEGTPEAGKGPGKIRKLLEKVIPRK